MPSARSIVSGGVIPPLYDRSADPTASRMNTAPPGSSASYDYWVQSQLPHYERNYTTVQAITFACCTYNVGCRVPPSQMDMAFLVTTSADVICIGLQEIDMSLGALWLQESELKTSWVNGIARAVGNTHTMLPSRQLGGLLLCVCIRSTLVPQLRGFKIATVMTGALGGTFANKGGVGIRFQIHRTTYCIINAHLAAHQEKVSERNRDISLILSQMQWITEEGPQTLWTPKEHDTVIVLGDLNYRINMSYEQAKSLCVQALESIGKVNGGPSQDPTFNEKVRQLLREDQLCKELQQKHTPWAGFTDLTPTHLPTYRFDLDTSTYDTSDKKRIPSFTDRVLFWSKALPAPSSPQSQQQQQGTALAAPPSPPAPPVPEAVVPLKHECVWGVTFSDHKPVKVELQLPMRVEVPTLKVQVIEKLKQTVRTCGLDRVASAKITCDKQDLDFGTISYIDCGQPQTITLTNIGECVAVINMSRNAIDDRSDGMWLRVSPVQLVILPGESSTVTIQPVADWAALRYLINDLPFQQTPHFKLSSFLMIAARSGSLLCVNCNAKLMPSCFGCSLESLRRCRHFPVPDAYAAGPSEAPLVAQTLGGGGISEKPQIPKELWTLVDAIAADPTATQQPDLFEDGADENEVEVIFQRLNQGLPLRFLSSTAQTAKTTTTDTVTAKYPGGLIASSASVAAALTQFLRDLPLSVIPPSHTQAAFAAGAAALAAEGAGKPSSADKECLAVLNHLPPDHFNAFVYIISFLRYMLRKGSSISAERLVAIFASVLFPLSSHSRPVVAMQGSQPSDFPLTVSHQPSVTSAAGFQTVAPAQPAMDLRKHYEEELKSAVQFLKVFACFHPELNCPC